MSPLEHLPHPGIIAGHRMGNEVGPRIQAGGRLAVEPVREDRSWRIAATQKADALSCAFLGLGIESGEGIRAKEMNKGVLRTRRERSARTRVSIR
ncbi:hypothetical protein E3T43_01050 [Cryobacterium sp. Hh7]|nr:hypothetical protein E3T43_01050 [Cryobacterium sp. Hh7]